MQKRDVPFLMLLLICLFSMTAVGAEMPEDMQLELNRLEGRLADAYARYAEVGAPHHVDLYPLAQARLNIAAKLASEKPDDEKTRTAMEDAALITDAAIKQIQVAINRTRLNSIQTNLASVLEQINTIHETINTMERSHAAKLKGELDETRTLAEQAQMEAEQARREAEQRLNELQSELISVSRDARGTIISMSDILFDVDKATLKPELKTSLAKIAGVLIVYREPKIVVEGHTDNTGTEEYNQRLSEARAQSVMDFLIEQGVDPARLTSVGYAFHRPVADNATKEGRQKNRRVDLIIKDNE